MEQPKNYILWVTGKQHPSVAELLELIEQGIEARHWYAHSLNAIKAKYGANWTLFARILAATSPLKSVQENCRIAQRVYNFIGVSTDITDLLTGFVAHDLNIGRINKGEELSGRKVKSFYCALIGDPNAVTVDRWIMRAYGLDKAPTKLDYDCIEYNVRNVLTVEHNRRFDIPLSPAQVQACLWAGVRKRADKVDSKSFADYL